MWTSHKQMIIDEAMRNQKKRKSLMKEWNTRLKEQLMNCQNRRWKIRLKRQLAKDPEEWFYLFQVLLLIISLNSKRGCSTAAQVTYRAAENGGCMTLLLQRWLMTMHIKRHRHRRSLIIPKERFTCTYRSL